MRLSNHLKNRHGQSWDRFSVYLTIGDTHLRELEALVLRIVKPKGNTQKGKFARSEDLKRRFGRDVRDRHRQEISMLLGRTVKTRRVKPIVTTTRKQAALARVLKGRAMRLRRRYKGELFKARLRPDGTVLFKGKIYRSPSAVGREISGHAINAWQFWSCERAPGDWVKLEKLRR